MLKWLLRLDWNGSQNNRVIPSAGHPVSASAPPSCPSFGQHNSGFRQVGLTGHSPNAKARGKSPSLYLFICEMEEMITHLGMN